MFNENSRTFNEIYESYDEFKSDLNSFGYDFSRFKEEVSYPTTAKTYWDFKRRNNQSLIILPKMYVPKRHNNATKKCTSPNGTVSDCSVHKYSL